MSDDNTLYTTIKHISGKAIFAGHYSSIAEIVTAAVRSGVDLRGADLRSAYLRGANLCGADLSEVKFNDADLSCADLSGANLRNSDLIGADLCDVDLRGADLHDADLSGADLCDVTGNGQEIITIQTNRYTVNFTDEIMQIGCERHPIPDWFAFDDDRIASMDKGALEWWRTWRPVIEAHMKATGVL